MALQVAPFAVFAVEPVHFESLMRGEGSYVEHATMAILAVAVAYALLASLRARQLPFPALRILMPLYLLGCIYFLGEEISWGQHLFDWETPAAWGAINDQHETNLHNISGVVGVMLDQLPRVTLTLAAFFAAFVMPFVRRKYGPLDAHQHVWAWLLPTVVCVPVGAMVVLFRPLRRAYDALAWGEHSAHFQNMPGGEVKECLIAVLLLLYITSFHHRAGSFLRAQRERSDQGRECSGLP